MSTAPIPPSDAARLQALRELLLLDTPPEERFDRIVSFAVAEFDVPTAMVSLVDESRTWFKARVGIDVCEAGRDVSFCAHAILAEPPLVIEDTLLDARFSDNPFVIGGPKIRFYAGAPLRLPSGHAAGTLCLLDTRPRTLDATDLAILETLRDLVVGELIQKVQA